MSPEARFSCSLRRAFAELASPLGACRLLLRGSHAACAHLTSPTATARARDRARLLSVAPARITGSDRVPGLSLSPPLSPEGKDAWLSLAFVGPSSAAGSRAQSLPCSTRGREQGKWLPKEIRDAVPRGRSRGCGGQQQMNITLKAALKAALCRRQVVDVALHCVCL